MSEWFIISICLATGIVTHLAFRNPSLKARLLFRPEMILGRKEWHRLFSSALIHADWFHAGFNLFALYSFGAAIEVYYGPAVVGLIYGLSVLGGSLLSLYLHRNHDYAALGASGGVCGVVFATIFLVPGSGVGLIFLPISIPGNVFAIVYLVLTFYALRKGVGNIGHDAHFGGAAVGLLLAFMIQPRFCLADPLFFWGSIAIVVICLVVLYIDPIGASRRVFPIVVTKARRPSRPTGDARYDGMIAERNLQREIDRILDKISRKGFDSLTPQERAVLDQRAERNRRR